MSDQTTTTSAETPVQPTDASAEAPVRTEIVVQKTASELALEKAKELVTQLEARLVQERELVASSGKEEQALALYLHKKFCKCAAGTTNVSCGMDNMLTRNMLDWNTADGREWLTKAAELVKDMPSTGWKVE